MPVDRSTLIPALETPLLRVDSLKATSVRQRHPTCCCSAADRVAALFFAGGRLDPKDPHNEDSDAHPVERACGTAAMPRGGSRRVRSRELLKLRTTVPIRAIHTAPAVRRRRDGPGFGPGICAAAPSAPNARRIKSDYRTTSAEDGERQRIQQPRRRAMDGLESVRHHRRQRASARAARTFQHDMQFWRRGAWLARDRRRHDRTRSSTPTPRRSRPRASRR